jgi:hypothetical protein
MDHQLAQLGVVDIRDGKPGQLRAAQATRLLEFNQGLPVGRLKIRKCSLLSVNSSQSDNWGLHGNICH